MALRLRACAWRDFHISAAFCYRAGAMRDLETIETELMEIAAIPDDVVKLERIIAWCAVHPDEVPFALHQVMGWHERHQKPHPSEP